MHRFRSSDISTYDRCPLLWHLKRQGWRAQRAAYRDVAARLGSAIHAGAAVYHEGLRTGQDLREAGHSAVLAYLGDTEQSDYADMKAAQFAARIYEDATAAYEAYTITDVLAGATIKSVEWTIPEWHTTLDVCYEQDGFVVVGDIKTRRFSSAWYKEQQIEEFRTAFQLYHYVSGYLSVYPEDEDRMAIALHLVELQTRKPRVTQYLYPVDRWLRLQYLRTAELRWAEMNLAVDMVHTPIMAVSHKDQYGKCEMHDVCFHGDRGRAAVVPGFERRQDGN
jgi:hypothetical protein